MSFHKKESFKGFFFVNIDLFSAIHISEVNNRFSFLGSKDIYGFRS